MGLTISKEQVAELPLEIFAGKTVVVDHESKVEKAIAELLKHSKIGFDTETKPAFKRGQVHNVALMQLYTIDVCYLFRLNKIGYPDELDEIICNPDIKKIGLSLRDDFAALRFKLSPNALRKRESSLAVERNERSSLKHL